MYNICILLLYYERIVHSLYIVRNVYCCCSFDVRKGQARIGARKITPVLGKTLHCKEISEMSHPRSSVHKFQFQMQIQNIALQKKTLEVSYPSVHITKAN